MTKYKQKFVLLAFSLALIFLVGCSQKSKTSQPSVQQKLTFSPVSDQLSQTIHQDFQKLFGMSAYGKEGATLAAGIMPAGYKAEKINDQYQLYVAQAKGQKVILDGSKINVYLDDKFYSDVFGYQKDQQGEYMGTSSGQEFYYDLIDKLQMSDAKGLMMMDISTGNVQYNEVRQIYRIEATGETTWVPMDYGGQKIPIVIYLDKSFAITDMYYDQNFSNMKGILDKNQVEKGIQAINDLQFNLNQTKDQSVLEKATKSHQAGSQIVGKNQVSSWFKPKNVLLGHRDVSYVNGKKLYNEAPIVDANGDISNKEQLKNASQLLEQSHEKSAGGKIDENVKDNEKVISVTFDGKRQLTKVKTENTVKLTNGKTGTYQQEYFMDENYQILADYTGTHLP